MKMGIQAVQPVQAPSLAALPHLDTCVKSITAALALTVSTFTQHFGESHRYPQRYRRLDPLPPPLSGYGCPDDPGMRTSLAIVFMM